MRGSRGGGGDPPGDAVGRWVVVAASLCVAVPSVAAAVQAIRWGWVPVSDQATISTRATEVLTRRTPRLGQLSGASAEVGLPTRSPGPMGYWPFAVTARWGPLWGTAVVAAALSGAAMVASVRLAARRGGPALALAVAAGLVLSARAINPANLASTWNPAVGIMPLVLLVFLAWSLAEDEVGLLPVAVLVASFCAQVHTVLAVPALLMLAIGAAVGLAPAVRSGLAAVRAGRRPARGPGTRAVVGAALVGAVCWALPILDQVTGDPGNLTRLSRASPDDRIPFETVGHVLVDAVGVVPAFLGGDPLPDEQAVALFVRSPSVLAVVTTVLVVVGLVGLAGHGLRRRRRDLAVPAALALALLLAGAATVRGTPGELFLVLTYTMWWLVPAAMLAWVVLVWGIGRAAGLGVEVASRLDRRWALAGTAVATAVLVAVAVLSPAQPEPEEPIHDEARAVGDAVVPFVDSGRRYLISGHGPVGQQLVASTAYRVRRAGGRPIVPGNDGIGAGPRYAPKGKRCEAVVTITADPPPSSAEVLVDDLQVPSRHGRASPVSVAIGPDDGRPSC